jgi:cytosine/adenosine deaminase-related metal-dependent hydrolase
MYDRVRLWCVSQFTGLFVNFRGPASPEYDRDNHQRHRRSRHGRRLGFALRTRQVIELDGKLVTAGWVDLHVHVFEWMTTFGLPPDDAGVHSGVTTAVDHGGAGAYTIPPSSITSPTAR